MAHTLEEIHCYENSLNKNNGEYIKRGDVNLNWLKTIQFPIPEQYIGVEVEVENITDSRYIYKNLNDCFYNITEDGSLRNNGIEIITKPIQAQYLETLIVNLFKALPTKADFSARTSIHIHMNVRNLNFEQLTNIVYTYITVEKLLYNWVGANRHKSIFCVPIQDTDLPICLNDFFQNAQARHLRWFKYTGMNLLPIFKLGTIEFRHLNGTRDTGAVLTWVNLLQHIFAYAIKTPAEELTQEILSINTTSAYLMFLESIFKEYTRALVYSGFEKDIESGVSYLKAFVFPNEFLLELAGMASRSSTLYKRLYSKDKVTVNNDLVDNWLTATKPPPNFFWQTGGGGGINEDLTPAEALIKAKIAAHIKKATLQHQQNVEVQF